jgi:hypothetical protein
MAQVAMIRPIAFCAGLALAWCATAEAQSMSPWVQLEDGSVVPAHPISRPDDATKVEIDDLRDRVKEIEGLLKALLSFLPECSGDPPEKMPCLERREAE